MGAEGGIRNDSIRIFFLLRVGFFEAFLVGWVD